MPIVPETIGQQPAVTSAADGDFLLIEQASTNRTKKITKANFLTMGTGLQLFTSDGIPHEGTVDMGLSYKPKVMLVFPLLVNDSSLGIVDFMKIYNPVDGSEYGLLVSGGGVIQVSVKFKSNGVDIKSDRESGSLATVDIAYVAIP